MSVDKTLHLAGVVASLVLRGHVRTSLMVARKVGLASSPHAPY